MRWATFFSKRYEPLKPYEKRILLSVGDQLSPEKLAPFLKQIEAIHSVERNGRKKEVLCRYRAQDKMMLKDASPFSNSLPERICASVRFQVASLNEAFQAEIGLVNGVLFSIEFNKSPKKIGRKPVAIQEAKIFPETMWPDPVQAPPESLKGPIGKWTDKMDFSSFHHPLSKKAFKEWVDYFNVSFPTEYLDIIKQTEGMESDNFIIYGLSSLSRVVFPDENYLILSEIKGCGVLTIGRSDSNGSIQFFDFEDEGPFPEEGSFCQVLENRLEKCCQQRPWLRDGFIPSSRELP